MASLDWKRLGAYVVARRTELGMMDRRQFAPKTGISYRTISNIETGVPVGLSTIGSVENVLGWEPGSAQRILEGGQPNIKGEEAEPERPAYADPVMQAAWESLADVDLPDDVKRGMINYARAAREDESRRRAG